MIRVFLDTPKTSNSASVVSLDGVDYQLSFLWNERADHWFLTVRDSLGTDLITARKLVADVPFAVHDTIDGMPDGQLWIVDSTGAGEDAGLRDLGSRVLVCYVDSENVA